MSSLIGLIRKHEGCELLMYKDTLNNNTVGFGHNMDSVPISKRAAEVILEDDIQAAINDCLTFYWFKHLDDVRTAVIVNMVFNMGLPTFHGFKQTIAFIELENFQSAGIEMMDSLWAKQTGNRAIELSQMMKTGKWND